MLLGSLEFLAIGCGARRGHGASRSPRIEARDAPPRRTRVPPRRRRRDDPPHARPRQGGAADRLVGRSRAAPSRIRRAGWRQAHRRGRRARAPRLLARAGVVVPARLPPAQLHVAPRGGPHPRDRAAPVRLF